MHYNLNSCIIVPDIIGLPQAKGCLGCITDMSSMEVDLTDTTVRVSCSAGSTDAVVVGVEVRGVHCSMDVFAPKLVRILRCDSA